MVLYNVCNQHICRDISGITKCNLMDEIIVTQGEHAPITELLLASGGKFSVDRSISSKLNSRLATMHKTQKNTIKDLIRQFNHGGVRGTEY